MSEDVSFYPGQQVVLKSGGPVMTVNYVSRKDGFVDCIWFDLEFGPERYHTRFSCDVLVPFRDQTLSSDSALQELRVGDVVKLRSGGPLMTIEIVKANGYESKTSCLWFDRRAMTPFSYGFHPNALVVES
ncbi:DUF2158 domain-containing protein [Aeromonas dhakensis]|uniref:DUF2158 domain-containing protein n=1 Tax=Aeromonas dhakensis TaxID=196024 RepID=UPI0038D04371